MMPRRAASTKISRPLRWRQRVQHGCRAIVCAGAVDPARASKYRMCPPPPESIVPLFEILHLLPELFDDALEFEADLFRSISLAFAHRVFDPRLNP